MFQLVKFFLFFFFQKNTIEEWTYIFAIGAAAYIIPAIVFMLFGSIRIQAWNEPTGSSVKSRDQKDQLMLDSSASEAKIGTYPERISLSNLSREKKREID